MVSNCTPSTLSPRRPKTSKKRQAHHPNPPFLLSRTTPTLPLIRRRLSAAEGSFDHALRLGKPDALEGRNLTVCADSAVARRGKGAKKASFKRGGWEWDSRSRYGGCLVVQDWCVDEFKERRPQGMAGAQSFVFATAIGITVRYVLCIACIQEALEGFSRASLLVYLIRASILTRTIVSRMWTSNQLPLLSALALALQVASAGRCKPVHKPTLEDLLRNQEPFCRKYLSKTEWTTEWETKTKTITIPVKSKTTVTKTITQSKTIRSGTEWVTVPAETTLVETVTLPESIVTLPGGDDVTTVTQVTTITQTQTVPPPSIPSLERKSHDDSHDIPDKLRKFKPKQISSACSKVLEGKPGPETKTSTKTKTTKAIETEFFTQPGGHVKVVKETETEWTTIPKRTKTTTEYSTLFETTTPDAATRIVTLPGEIITVTEPFTATVTATVTATPEEPCPQWGGTISFWYEPDGIPHTAQTNTWTECRSLCKGHGQSNECLFLSWEPETTNCKYYISSYHLCDYHTLDMEFTPGNRYCLYDNPACGGDVIPKSN